MGFAGSGLRRAWLTVVGCLVMAAPVSGGQLVTRAVVNVPVASIYRHPTFAAERVTQALLGSEVLVLGLRGYWAQVVVCDQYREPQGYPGWVLLRQIARGAQIKEPNLLVAVPRSVVYRQAHVDSQPLAVVYCSSLLESLEQQSGWRKVALPGSSTTGFVSSRDVSGDFLPPTGAAIVETALRFRGTPYVWGGLSTQGIDCSGLVYVVYRAHGYLLPRDADQQYLVGAEVQRADLQPGDLVFFGKDEQHIVHVGISLGQERYVDASGKYGVSISHLGPERQILGARRIIGSL